MILTSAPLVSAPGCDKRSATHAELGVAVFEDERLGKDTVDGSRNKQPRGEHLTGDPSLAPHLEGVAHASGDNGSRSRDDWSVLAITLDRKEVPVGILEPGEVAAAGAG
jgi:hypothetical protein